MVKKNKDKKRKNFDRFSWPNHHKKKIYLHCQELYNSIDNKIIKKIYKYFSSHGKGRRKIYFEKLLKENGEKGKKKVRKNHKKSML